MERKQHQSQLQCADCVGRQMQGPRLRTAAAAAAPVCLYLFQAFISHRDMCTSERNKELVVGGAGNLQLAFCHRKHSKQRLCRTNLPCSSTGPARPGPTSPFDTRLIHRVSLAASHKTLHAPITQSTCCMSVCLMHFTRKTSHIAHKCCKLELAGLLCGKLKQFSFRNCF